MHLYGSEKNFTFFNLHADSYPDSDDARFVVVVVVLVSVVVSVVVTAQLNWLSVSQSSRVGERKCLMLGNVSKRMHIAHTLVVGPSSSNSSSSSSSYNKQQVCALLQPFSR